MNTEQSKYVGMLPGTKPFGLKKVSKEDKEMCLDRIEKILDNLDDIQRILGLKEYVKQMSHWQAVRSGIKNEF